MKTHGIALLGLCLAMSLSGCGPGTCIDPSTLTYRVQRGDAAPSKGDSTEVELIVTNRSEMYMLVAGISGAHLAPGGPDSLIAAEQGSLEPDRHGGFRLVMEAQQETPPIFASGLIPPGQKLAIQVEIVPQDPAGSFSLSYWGLSAEEACRHLLFPALVKGELDRGTFVSWNAEALDEAVKKGGGEGTRSPIAVHVLLGKELQQSRPRCTVDMPYRLKLQQ